MKKLLPINVNPYIHTYTQHGFFHAMTGADDKVCFSVEDSVAEIYVSEYEKYNWQEQTDQLNYTVDSEGRLIFTANKWNVGMNMAFWRECQKQDELSLRIDKQLYSNAWSAITVFITPDTDCNMTDMNEYRIVVGHFEKDGVFFSVKRGKHNRFDCGFKKPMSLKMIRENNDIFMTFCDEEESFESYKIYHIENEEEKYRIGFAINLGNSAYNEWVYSNYIQLFARPNDIIPVDYIVNVHKDWCVHTSNTLIDYHRIKVKELKKLKVTELDYIKLQIDLDSFVEVELNDNLNFNRTDEKGKFFHQNLIYGYDDDKQCLYTLFYKMGKIAKGIVSYKDFESERNKGGAKFLYMMHYNPCSEYFTLYPKRLLWLYKDYRNSENISLYESFYLDNFMIGMSCYEYFTIGEGVMRTYLDIRVIFLFFEKAVCDKDRVEYLYARGIISQEAYEKLTELLVGKIKTLGIIKNAVLKNTSGGRLKKDSLSEYLEDALENEKKFVDMMIDVLESI